MATTKKHLSVVPDSEEEAIGRVPVQSVKAIRDFESWQKSLANFEWLEGVLPGACDADLLCHARCRGGGDRFLILEGKHPTEKMPLGQRLMLEALAKQPGWTVVTARGPFDDGFYTLSGSWTGKCDREGLKSMVAEWWKNAKTGCLQHTGGIPTAGAPDAA